MNAPEPVRRIVAAVIDRALAQCEREGIDPGDFYRAMVEEGKPPRKGNLPALIERTFARLARQSS